MRADALSKVRQELHCHNCDRHVQFELDMAMEGNHIITCPNCKHEHCRVIRRGKITSERWGQRNGPTYSVSQYSNVTYSILSNSTWSSSTAGSTSSNFYTFYGTGGTGSWATA
jgi:hypothetical protein